MDKKDLNNECMCDIEYDDCECGHDDCGCGHEHEEEAKIHLILEDDTEMECTVLGIFEVDGKEYIALLPENDDRVLLYQYNESEGGIELNNIEDDDEFRLVSDVYRDMFEDVDEYDED